MELIDTNLIQTFLAWLNANGNPYQNQNALLANIPQAIVTYQAWVIANGNGLPPVVAPIELHPDLAANPINLNSTKLIIGTFPPISYMCDQLGILAVGNPNGNAIARPKISFFHG